MKELSIEEKAKHYDGLIERLKDLQFAYRFSPLSDTIEEKFPELVESEDERIRKNIIKAFKIFADKQAWVGHCLDNIDWDACIAWLEKQTDNAKFINSIQIGDKVTRNEDGMLVNLSQLKRIAKKDENQDEQKPDNWLQELEDKLANATPEQLAEWKEKYFKEEPAEWSEEDETNIGRAIDIIKDAKEGLLSYKTDDGIYECEQAIKVLDKLLKNGYSVLWKETDYDNIEKLIKILPQCIFRHPHILERDECLKLVSWLKSFRPQNTWKPSNEQIKALETTLYSNMSRNDERYSVLSEFVTELKKLREE